MTMLRRTFIALLGTSMVAAAATTAAQDASPRRGWAPNAEREFGLGAGMGPKLMTEEEWKEHQTKMRTLQGSEREAYRREMHDRMVARAKDRGIDMPQMPAPGARPGRGPGR